MITFHKMVYVTAKCSYNGICNVWMVTAILCTYWFVSIALHKRVLKVHWYIGPLVHIGLFYNIWHKMVLKVYCITWCLNCIKWYIAQSIGISVTKRLKIT